MNVTSRVTALSIGGGYYIHPAVFGILIKGTYRWVSTLGRFSKVVILL
jgi:hypothetical protein